MRPGRARNPEPLGRQAIFTRTTRQDHVCGPRRIRTPLDRHRIIRAARKVADDAHWGQVILECAPAKKRTRVVGRHLLTRPRIEPRLRIRITSAAGGDSVLSACQNWRAAHLDRQLDERHRSASSVKQMPRVRYCRAQQWRRDHGLAGTSFLGSTRPAVRSTRAQEPGRYSLDLASRTR